MSVLEIIPEPLVNTIQLKSFSELFHFVHRFSTYSQRHKMAHGHCFSVSGYAKEWLLCVGQAAIHFTFITFCHPFVISKYFCFPEDIDILRSSRVPAELWDQDNMLDIFVLHSFESFGVCPFHCFVADKAY